MLRSYALPKALHNVAVLRLCVLLRYADCPLPASTPDTGLS